MDEYVRALHAAGDAGRCDAEVERVRGALVGDAGLTLDELRREAQKREIHGSMPYPSPGTACALFGIQRALAGAISERAGAAGAAHGP